MPAPNQRGQTGRVAAQLRHIQHMLALPVPPVRARVGRVGNAAIGGAPGLTGHGVDKRQAQQQPQAVGLMGDMDYPDIDIETEMRRRAGRQQEQCNGAA